jgi:hypothetical protein
MCGLPNVAPALAGFVSDSIDQFCMPAKWSGALKMKFENEDWVAADIWRLLILPDYTIV